MLALGVFCGKYMTDCRDEFPASWFAKAKLSPERKDCSLNFFGVDASQPLSVWRAKGWIYHEDPQVLHYGEPDTGLELKAGMTFTIEPMVNAGKRHVRLLGDGWTVVTKDHSLSAQWEHTVLVTETGVEVLTLGEGSKRPASYQ